MNDTGQESLDRVNIAVTRAVYSRDVSVLMTSLAVTR